MTTDTHDAKRSADVRARIAALSEIPHEWIRSVNRWRKLNDKHRRILRGRMAPDTNTEYLFYQTLIALWPGPRQGRRIDDLPDRAWRESLRTRLSEYTRKAAREAKTRTSWTDPDPAYEEALETFIAAVFEPHEDAPFLTDVARLVSVAAPIAAWSSLSKLVLHLTSPGTPDIYQGDEVWNYALVDPDNRRPVDYDARSVALSKLTEVQDRVTQNAAIDPFDNRLKLFVTQRLLELRRSHADVFAQGVYRPLTVKGPRADNVIAFARTIAGRTCVTVAARLVAGIMSAPDPSASWADTAIEMPAELDSSTWRSALTDNELPGTTGTFRVSELFVMLPSAVLIN
jgi:(1->4)-alpha-D-glucan 1-alpha-D-glucosylmutase